MRRSLLGLIVLLNAGCSEGLTQLPDDGGAKATCEAGSFCVEVRGTAPPLTRLGIVWSPLGATAPPQVAWEMPLQGMAHVKVPIAQIAAPVANEMSCARSCMDPAMCPCGPAGGIGVGYVLAAVDTNANGKIDLDATLNGDALVGAGWVVLGWASEPYAAPNCRDPNALCTYALKYFPQGMPRGINPYSVIRAGGGGRDTVGAAAPLFEFPLDFCAGSPCTPAFPDIQ